MEIDNIGGKMGNNYYSIRMYVEEHPLTINCQDLLEMADAIGDLLGCKYDYFGYVLLDPDYDYKDLGLMMKNSKKNRDKFLSLSIPTIFKGKKDNLSSAPFVTFEMRTKDNIELPFYELQLIYPTNNSHYLCVQMDVKEELMTKEIALTDFSKMQDIVSSKGYVINSAFLDYYTGNSRRMNLDGGEYGITTVNDWRIIDHSIKFHQEWKNKIMDVFYMNSFNKNLVSSEAIDKIVKIVGNENIIEHDQKFIFKLPQSKLSYLLNRILMMKSRRNVKKILEDEKVCFKDASIMASILKL